jgi:pimeloyl-ACP methyl ester carboxylesterase
MSSKFEQEFLNDDVRKTLSGSFIKLEKGVTHYELEGDENAPLVVLVHGISLAMWVWDNNFKALVDAGFRVLRYDLFGRGYSDRPKAKYDEIFYDDQLTQLLSVLNLASKSISLIGLSMGGGVCTVFSARHPEMVRSLTLVDSAGFKLPKSGKDIILKTPGLNKFFFSKFGTKILYGGIWRNFYGTEKIPEIQAKFIEQLRFQGFNQAIWSSLQHNPMEELESYYQDVEKSAIPVQIIWGDQDPVIPPSTIDIIKSIIPRSVVHVIKNARHMPQYEYPDIINPFIVAFLRSKENK